MDEQGYDRDLKCSLDRLYLQLLRTHVLTHVQSPYPLSDDEQQPEAGDAWEMFIRTTRRILRMRILRLGPPFLLCLWTAPVAERPRSLYLKIRPEEWGDFQARSRALEKKTINYVKVKEWQRWKEKKQEGRANHDGNAEDKLEIWDRKS